MTIGRWIIFLALAFALLPLVLPARQLALDESAAPAESASPEAAAVLDLVKKLEEE